MERRTVQLKVAGQTYKVVTSADTSEIERLAGIVNDKVTEISKSKVASPQTMLLAAIALAHDLEEERARREALERRTRDLLRRVLMRIDDAIEDAHA